MALSQLSGCSLEKMQNLQILPYQALPQYTTCACEKQNEQVYQCPVAENIRTTPNYTYIEHNVHIPAVYSGKILLIPTGTSQETIEIILRLLAKS